MTQRVSSSRKYFCVSKVVEKTMLINTMSQLCTFKVILTFCRDLPAILDNLELPNDLDLDVHWVILLAGWVEGFILRQFRFAQI